MVLKHNLEAGLEFVGAVAGHGGTVQFAVNLHGLW